VECDLERAVAVVARLIKASFDDMRPDKLVRIFIEADRIVKSYEETRGSLKGR
jgi:hypothetical protein